MTRQCEVVRMPPGCSAAVGVVHTQIQILTSVRQQTTYGLDSACDSDDGMNPPFSTVGDGE
jgi:hypothetical protein